MTSLPTVSGKAVIQALERAGFRVVRIRGSHYYLRKPGAGPIIPVPVHSNRDLPAGTLRSILRRAGLSVDEFVAPLRDET